MKLKDYLSTFEGLKAENRWNRIATIALIGLAVGQSVLLAIRPTIVTIQPWTLSQNAEITKSSASQSYIEAWGLALAELLGNVTPSSSGFVANQLKPLLDPSIYHQTLDALYANAEELRADRVAQRFEPRKIVFEKSTGKVFVHGYSFIRYGNSLESEKRQERTYEFGIKIAHYAPLVTYINTYRSTPQTVDVLKREKAREEKAEQRAQAKAVESKYRYSTQANLIDGQEKDNEKVK